MSKLVVSEFVTLDGVMEDPGGGEPFERGGWAFKFARGADGDIYKQEELTAAGALLLGRVTYEGFAQAWPRMQEDDFGKKMNEMPKYVFSSTLERADWNNSTILAGDLRERISELRASVQGDILVAGSARLVQGLTELGVVDEYRLMIFPLVLGAGKRLFAYTPEAISLRATEVRPVGDEGVTVATYLAA